MRSPLLSLAVAVALGTVLALVGSALDFGGPAWLAAFVVALFVTSLVDRERFYGPPLEPRLRSRQRNAGRNTGS